jgi:hypothetical protein
MQIIYKNVDMYILKKLCRQCHKFHRVMVRTFFEDRSSAFHYKKTPFHSIPESLVFLYLNYKRHFGSPDRSIF